MKERMTTEEMEAKLSERKTVHEWLNRVNIPKEENGEPICLLRRMSIACDRLRLLEQYRRLFWGPEYKADKLLTLKLLAATAEREAGFEV